MSAYSWTLSDIPSLQGTTVVVTGANSGIGWHTAAELARHGADVTLAVRNVDKGEAAADRLRETGAGAVRVSELDLGSLASVRKFAEGWTGPLGLLVNNAGVMTPPRWTATADGHELQFGTNHLGHFALTGLLLPHLLEAPAPRVVTVSSIAHRRGGRDVVEGNPQGRYSADKAYGNSKLANLLFAIELQRRAAAGRLRAHVDGCAPRRLGDQPRDQRAGSRLDPRRHQGGPADPQGALPVGAGRRAADAVRRDRR